MLFNYSVILKNAPCFCLVKNLRYFQDNYRNPIERGEIIEYSNDLTSLSSKLSFPKLEFDSKQKLKFFLYSMGFFPDLQQFSGSELFKKIEGKSLIEIDSEIHDSLSNEDVLNILFQSEKLKKWQIVYDFGGTAYQQKNKLRDYQFFNETYDIRFFGGENEEQLFEFIRLYFEKKRWTLDIHVLLKEIRFDFFEMLDCFNGKKQIFPYDLWHEFLYFIFKRDLIDDKVFNEYSQEKYF